MKNYKLDVNLSRPVCHSIIKTNVIVISLVASLYPATIAKHFAKEIKRHSLDFSTIMLVGLVWIILKSISGWSDPPMMSKHTALLLSQHVSNSNRFLTDVEKDLSP